MSAGFEKGCLVFSNDEWHVTSHVFLSAFKVDTRADWTSKSIVVISRKEMILIPVRTVRCVTWITYPVRQDSLHFFCV